MSSDEIDTMLSNLEEIKNGGDPRSESLDSNDALEVLQAEVDRLFRDFPEVRDAMDREQVHCAVARWDGRNGYCRYNVRTDGQKRFNKRMAGTPSTTGHHIVAVNEKILEQGNREGFLDTTRHELAHAVVYEIYNESQKHNANWQSMAAKLGADPSSCHHKRDRSDEYQYYITCPNCGMENGKTKRSKVIKQPFNRRCGLCGENTLSSYEAGQEPPTENGVVKVESLDWDNEFEWRRQGQP